MKKALIGTTALVAGGLIAGSAAAADLIPAPAPEIVDDGFSATWSGYIRSGFYIGDSDCDTSAGAPCFVSPAGPAVGAPADVENTVVPINGELQLFLEQTLANGLRVGGEIDFGIAARSGAAVTIDELWIFIEGHFGEIRLGQKDGALDSLGGGSMPGWGAFNGGTDGPDMAPLAFNNLNGIARATVASGNRGSQEDISGDQNKIVYFTPTIANMNFGVSFTPDPDNEDGTGRTLDTNGSGGVPGVGGFGVLGNAVAAANRQYVNEWEFGANGSWTAGDTTFTLAGGFMTNEAEQNNMQGDITIWKVAGSVRGSYGGIGAWYTNRDNDTVNSGVAATSTPSGSVTETQSWGVLGNIIYGDWTFGGGYTSVTDEHYNGIANGSNWADSELDIWGIGASQKLGTGVEHGINATFESLDEGHDRNGVVVPAGCNAAGCVDADGWLAGYFIAISF